MKRLESGFTLLELTLVIVLIGILSVTVIPKFFSERGFEEHAVKNNIISFLRLVQTQAMQNTSGGCSTVLVTEDVIGIPDNCDINDGIDTGDDNNIKNFVAIADRNQVGFDVSSGDYSFTFDNDGRPTGDCSPCNINIVGQSTLTVRIEVEGYIHEE